MASYYRHKATHSRNIPYSFRCEHCMKDSGPLTATISGTEAFYDSYKNKLTEKQTESLNKDAHKFLVNRMYIDYTNATEKSIYALEFKDACPHCQQPQSWAISGFKKDMMIWPAVLVVLGAIVGLGTYFFLEDKNIMQSIIFGGVFVLAAVLVFIYKSIKLGIKKKKISLAQQRNIPTIDWSVATDLLNEKRAKTGK